MTTVPAIELRTFTTLDTARGDLLDVYADVRAPCSTCRTTRSPPSANAWTGTAPSLGSRPSSRTRTGTRSATPTATPSSTATATGSAPARRRRTSTPSARPWP